MGLRAYWAESTAQRRNFTSKLLKWWFVRCGGHVADGPKSADIVFASICSPREINVISSARRVADEAGLPLVVGGPEGYLGATLLGWADYVCVGEGYRLLQDMAATASTASAREVLGLAGNVLCKSDPDAAVYPDYCIPWRYLPPVQTAKRGFYYLAGRGCSNKCTFCFTSWTQPRQVIGEKLLSAAESKLGKLGKLVLVTNEAGRGAGAGSTMLSNFLESDRTDWPMVIRLGVEGVTEERRAAFHKPMSDKQVAEACRKAAALHRQLELFFIVGWPDDPAPSVALQGVASALGVERIRHPRIYLKFTWFEPAPHTPLAKWDVSQLVKWDYDLAAMSLRSISGRFRVFKAGKTGLAIWSAILRRLPPHLAVSWAARREEVGAMTVSEACKAADSAVGAGYVDGSATMPWEMVRVSRSPASVSRWPASRR